jgi:hypothetical protein
LLVGTELRVSFDDVLPSLERQVDVSTLRIVHPPSVGRWHGIGRYRDVPRSRRTPSSSLSQSPKHDDPVALLKALKQGEYKLVRASPGPSLKVGLHRTHCCSERVALA